MDAAVRRAGRRLVVFEPQHVARAATDRAGVPTVRSIASTTNQEPDMRRFAANATHLAAALAVTAAAVIVAFSMPLPAQALTISVFGDGNTVSGSGKEVTVARQVGAFSV